MQLEFSIPRMGRRIDTVLLVGPVVFVVEFFDDCVHLAVSMRSFRAENVSQFVKALLDSLSCRPRNSGIDVSPPRILDTDRPA